MASSSTGPRRGSTAVSRPHGSVPRPVQRRRPDAPTHPYPGPLLPALGDGRGLGTIQAATVQRWQQTVGNQAVQRLIALHQPPIGDGALVQREDSSEDSSDEEVPSHSRAPTDDEKNAEELFSGWLRGWETYTRWTAKPKEQCYPAANAIGKALEKYGIEVFFQGVLFWQSHDDTLPMSHIVVVATIGGAPIAIDPTAGQFSGISGPIVAPYDVWKERIAALRARYIKGVRGSYSEVKLFCDGSFSSFYGVEGDEWKRPEGGDEEKHQKQYEKQRRKEEKRRKRNPPKFVDMTERMREQEEKRAKKEERKRKKKRFLVF
jgi:hypothetical protein